jgi:hypothetical protein
MALNLTVVSNLINGAEAAWGVVKADLPQETADAQAIIAAVEKGFADTKTNIASAIAAFKAAV